MSSDNKAPAKSLRLSSQLREFVNDSVIQRSIVYAKKDDGVWDQCWAAFDAFDDTSEAIVAFSGSEHGLFQKHPYLATYGLMQALVVQQDSLNYIERYLFGNDHVIDFKSKKNAPLLEIRNIRNETIGHPVVTERVKGKSSYVNDEITSCTIIRVSISEVGFEYLLWKSSGVETRTVNFSQIIAQQSECVNNELKAMLEKLEKAEKAHKSKFRGDHLARFMKMSSYDKGVLRQVAHGHILGISVLNKLTEEFKMVVAGLEARYGPLDGVPSVTGTVEVLKRVGHVLMRMRPFINGESNPLDYEIYVAYLIQQVEELRDHLEEIDNAFGSPPRKRIEPLSFERIIIRDVPVNKKVKRTKR